MAALKISITICALLLVISFFSTVSATVSAGDVVIEEFPGYSTGDYFNFDLKADNFVDSIGTNIAGDDYIGAEDVVIGDMETRITGEDTVTVGGTEYSCVIAEFTWEMSFTLLFEEGSAITDDDRLTYQQIVSETTSWWDKAHQTTVKSENRVYLELHYQKDGESHITEAETITKETYSSITGEEMRFPLRVGNTWSLSSTYTSNTTMRSRTDDEDWEQESYEEEINETTEYEVVSENIVTVEAGTFDCLKLKTQEHGESDYSIAFYDRSGVPAKMLEYDADGTLSMSMELKSYRVANEKGSSSGDDDFEIMGMDGYLVLGGIGSAIAVTVVAGIMVIHRRVEEGDEIATVRKSRAREKGRGAAAPSMAGMKAGTGAPPRPRAICPTCRRTVRFIPQYRQHWCDSCQQYVRPRMVTPRPPVSSQSAVVRTQAPRPSPPPDRCPECRSKGEYSEEYEDYYCWECEEYFEDLR